MLGFLIRRKAWLELYSCIYYRFFMKIISLNIWGGRIHNPLLNFFRSVQDIDAFCLQEVFDGHDGLDEEGNVLNIFSQIQSALPNHEGFFAPAQKGFRGFADASFGLAMFIRRELNPKKPKSEFIHLTQNSLVGNDMKTLGKNIQYTIVDGLTLAHFHGLWTGGDKEDSATRISQSNTVMSILEKQPHLQVLMGDFNLLPHTASLKILTNRRRDLIAEFTITSTRSSLYTKHPRFADYAIVTPDLAVKNFHVLQDEISDHLPLLLEVRELKK